MMNILEIGNEWLGLRILPECGGKIASLVDRRSGVEWLWQNPALKQVLPRFGDSYVESLDTGGWDEILPSIAPCLLPGGQEVPDHGDLVSQAWKVIEAEAARVVMEVECRYAPLRLRREIELKGSGIEVGYRLANDGRDEVPWMWFVHPLLPLEIGGRIECDLPDGFRVAGGVGIERGRIGVEELNELLADGAQSWGLKLFAERGAVSRVVFRRPNGEGIAFSWDKDELPYLSLWLNHGGWAGVEGAPNYRNIGIEPGTAAGDSLVDELAAGRASQIAGGEVRDWRVGLELLGPEG